MKHGLKKDTLETIERYSGTLGAKSKNELNVLQDSVAKIKKFGVDGFSYEIFEKNGEGALFSTIARWREIMKEADPKFFKQMSEHINYEILHVKQNKLLFITRSRDKVHTPYLQKLDDYGLNNSVSTYHFAKNKIEVFNYFFEDVIQRDIILNSLEYFALLTNNMYPALKLIADSKEFKAQKRPILTKRTLDQLWNGGELNCSRKKISVNFNNHEISLTTREVQCLVLLKQGCSNKYISNRLSLSESTVKGYIYNLKEKFFVNHKKDLIKIAQSKELSHIHNIIKET